MESGGYKIVQIKRENKCDMFDEVKLNIEDVDFSDASTIQCKSEQVNSDFDCNNPYGDVKIEIVEKVPGKCEVSNSSGIGHIDQRSAYCKFEEQKEEKYVAVKLKIEDVGFTDASTIQCKSEQVNSDFDCNNQYGDVKIEIVENVPGKCEVYDASGIDQRNTGVIPFLCRIYSKAFANSGDLKSHERIHTGKKPFLCTICSKAFAQSGELNAHARVHTGLKLFHCKICSRAFTQSCNLKTHERVHTGVKSFYCEVCSKAFSHSGNLKRHKRIHTRQK